GEGIGDPAERRLDAPAPREEAVDLVRDACGAEDDRRRPAAAPVAREHQPCIDRDHEQSRKRQRIRQLLLQPRSRGWCGHIDRISPMPKLSLPGFVNAHSHAFQRALRGRTEGGDFWAWRDAMLELARCQTPELVKGAYVTTYEEMLHSGYTAVGEFHYLGFDLALAAAEAAAEAEIRFVLLYAAYAVPPFAQPSVADYLRDVERLREQGLAVGVAPHSVRACPPDWLEEIGTYAEREGLVLHVHACEQPREVEECIEAHGMRPIELLARSRCLGPRTTVVHATHASDAELDLLHDAGARVCVCPTTE